MALEQTLEEFGQEALERSDTQPGDMGDRNGS
jgi:hypothetical protein